MEFLRSPSRNSPPLAAVKAKRVSLPVALTFIPARALSRNACSVGGSITQKRKVKSTPDTPTGLKLTCRNNINIQSFHLRLEHVWA